MTNDTPSLLSADSMLGAYRTAVTGSKADIQVAIAHHEGAARGLLRAVLAQYEGDVPSAVSLLRRLLRSADGADAAAIADVLAPILVMKGDIAGVSEMATILADGGWTAAALAFRTLISATNGDRRTAGRRFVEAQAAIDGEDDEIKRFRVLQRLSLAAFHLGRYDEAVDLALASAALCTKHEAWRAAAAGYSIAYNVHHAVTGDLLEADRYARLCRQAALLSDDSSFARTAHVAEYEIAVQLADRERAEALEDEIKRRLLPEQYAENFAFAASYALLRGADDVTAMRTLLIVLRSTRNRSRGETAYCLSLIALSCAALHEDAEAQEAVEESLSHLGRASRHEPGYERNYRRLARVSIAATCALLGKHVRAQRVISVSEMYDTEGLSSLLSLIDAKRWGAFPKELAGLAGVYAVASRQREKRMAPDGLTTTEFEVLRMLADGWSAGKIAGATTRSVHTVYAHTRAILLKLDASRAAEAVAIARARGYF